MAVEKVGYELTLRDLMSKSLGDINSKFDKLEASLKRTEVSATKSTSNMGKAFAVLGGIFAVDKMKDFGLQVMNTTARFQSLGSTIKFASDSAIQGDASMIWISQMSQKYGLPLEETAEGFKTLQGAMLKTKFSSGQVRKMFEQVSTGAVAMGLSADDAKGVFLALGQIMGKGKVSAEELRGQIGERVPGAFSIAARAMGVTTAKLDDMMKKGELISEDFLPKFAAEMEKTFGKQAENSIDSLSASINRIANSWKEFQILLGNTQVAGLLYKSMDGYGKMLDAVNHMLKSNKQLMDEANNPHVMSYLDNFETRMKGFGDDLKKKGYSKKQIEEAYRKEIGSETSNLDRLFGIANKDLENKKNALNNKSLAEKLVPGLMVNLGLSKSTRGEKRDLEAQEEKVDLISKEKAGASQMLDKLLTDLYRPSGDAGESDADKKLKKESNSISGNTPKTVNIHVDALIKATTAGAIQNIINNAQNAKSDLASFMRQLEQALLTVVNDVNIISE